MTRPKRTGTNICNCRFSADESLTSLLHSILGVLGLKCYSQTANIQNIVAYRSYNWLNNNTGILIKIISMLHSCWLNKKTMNKKNFQTVDSRSLVISDLIVITYANLIWNFDWLLQMKSATSVVIHKILPKLGAPCDTAQCCTQSCSFIQFINWLLCSASLNITSSFFFGSRWRCHVTRKKRKGLIQCK